MAASHQEFSLTVLPNGVRLIMVPMQGIKSVASAVFVGAGSRYETPAINGISHFLEHMVFKGTKQYPTTEDVNVIERMGGIQNAYTDIDVTNYHNKVLATDWKLGLEINKELSLHPLLEQEHVDRERDVILEEMKRYEDEPASKVEELVHTMMYPGTRLGMRIIGEEASLRSITSKELAAYHASLYVPEKLVVVLAGGLAGRENEIADAVDGWFGGLTGSPTADIERVTENQTAPQVKTLIKKDAAQAHFFLSLRTFQRGKEERHAWNVFNLLMGVSFTSRLFREIREKRGLCYHIRSSANAWADTGNWQIYAGVATQKLEEAVGAVVEELRKVRSEGVTEEEVEIAKKRLTTILAFRAEDPEFQNEFYGRQEVYGQHILSFSEQLKRIAVVTKADINVLLEKYLTTKTLNLAVVASKADEAKLLSLLKIE